MATLEEMLQIIEIYTHTIMECIAVTIMKPTTDIKIDPRNNHVQ